MGLRQVLGVRVRRLRCLILIIGLIRIIFIVHDELWLYKILYNGRCVKELLYLIVECLSLFLVYLELIIFFNLFDIPFFILKLLPWTLLATSLRSNLSPPSPLPTFATGKCPVQSIPDQTLKNPKANRGRKKFKKIYLHSWGMNPQLKMKEVLGRRW